MTADTINVGGGAAQTLSGSGAISLNANNGVLTVGGALTGGGVVGLTAAGGLNSVLVNAAISSASGANITVSAAGAITQSGTGSFATTGTLSTSSTTGQTLSGAGTNAVTTFNALNTTSGDITLANNVATGMTIGGAGISEAGGNITVDAANLVVTLGGGYVTPTPANGDKFVIVSNDSTDAVTVTNPFKVSGVSILEGDAFTASGNRFVITYAGIGGVDSQANDVILTVQNFTTELKLDVSGNLVVTDIASGGQDDTLTVKSNTATGKFEISDPNRNLGISGTIPSATVSGDLHTVFVPFTSVTGNVLVNTLAGNRIVGHRQLNDGRWFFVHCPNQWPDSNHEL